MKTFVCLLAAGALLCGCSRQPEPVRWEYNRFQCPGYKNEEFAGPSANYILINSESNTIYDAGELLNQVGRYGWELTWSDGNNFIVKRPAGVFTNGDFAVGTVYLPKN